ncbi:geranylgeranyl pyrophosphate synthase [Terriglobus roseus DSM 18391]|uniref:Geranylgeranyl pyrophosphate synthase n=1 Tax=Terriglobus roseus (strain DSM 18391 / NRRL B-41598 / KBS 63) TaxID=926566 RepID=I3ZMI1_TERRK|nr:polyprenyl synthetase family protein [Terriglobus roseus]AFL90449.1 geranylgeranyl pyrophosphate synthase [Terriglobus roseus DSM 18391]
MKDLKNAQLGRVFQELLPLPATMEPRLKQALQYILGNPGSLIRPGVLIRVALEYGLAERPATDLAIGLEYFHTASLIFDDLPSMDDAVERRGRECVHLKFGEAGATLAALALVNRAYALTFRSIAAAPAAVQAEAQRYVERSLGVDGLLNGQSMDVHFAALPHDLQTTERAAVGKTVSLVRLTLVLPAILGRAAERDMLLLDKIAVCWGLSYQIVDDLKDRLESTSATGKTSSRDLLLDRPNVALAIGIDGAMRRLKRLLLIGDKALNRLLATRPGLAFLRELHAALSTDVSRLLELSDLRSEGEAA